MQIENSVANTVLDFQMHLEYLKLVKRIDNMDENEEFVFYDESYAPVNDWRLKIEKDYDAALLNSNGVKCDGLVRMKGSNTMFNVYEVETITDI